MTGCFTVYVTAPDLAEAERLADAAVTERLAACANIIPSIRSIYRWQGKLEHAHEYALILKTTANKRDSLIARIKALHSYDCPCIVAYAITAGDSNYLDWIKGEI